MTGWHLRGVRGLLLLLVPFLCIGCGLRGRSREEVRIGIIAMLSGENARNGRSMVDAAELALESAGRNGTIKIGKRNYAVRYFVEDDGNTPEGAMNAARALIYKDRVAALVGPQFSSNAIPVARLAEREKVIMICPLSTNPETTSGKRYVFRIPYLDTFQGAVLARFAREVLGADRAAVLFDAAGVYNRTLADVFRESFEAAGGVVCAYETYTTDQNRDFGSQLARIGRAEPQVLFLPNYAQDAMRQASQARQRGIKAVLLGGDGWDAEAFALNRDFEGSYMTRHWHPDVANAKARVFTEKFRKAYGREADDVAGLTYDALNVIFEAMNRAAKVDPEPVQKALYATGPYEGVSGTIRYEDGGDPVKSAIICEIRGSESSVYKVIEPEPVGNER